MTTSRTWNILSIGQISYHQTTLRRCHNMERDFIWRDLPAYSDRGRVSAAPGDRASCPGDRFHWLSPVLTFLCGFLPAPGAALAAISDQGEFRSLTKQSQAMRGAQLRNCLPEIKRLREVINKALPGSPASQLSANAEKLGRSASDLLVKEVLDPPPRRPGTSHCVRRRERKAQMSGQRE